MSERTKPSDHSVLSCTLDLSSYSVIRKTSDHYHGTEAVSKVRKYDVTNIPINFMNSDSAKAALIYAIDGLQSVYIWQYDINSIYDEFLTTVHEEMDKTLEHHE